MQALFNHYKCQKKFPFFSRLSGISLSMWPLGSTGHHHEGAGEIMEGCSTHCHSQHCS